MELYRDHIPLLPTINYQPIPYQRPISFLRLTLAPKPYGDYIGVIFLHSLLPTSKQILDGFVVGNMGIDYIGVYMGIIP